MHKIFVNKKNEEGIEQKRKGGLYFKNPFSMQNIFEKLKDYYENLIHIN